MLPEAPPTPDRLNDFGILKVSDHLSKVNHRNNVFFMIDYFIISSFALMNTYRNNYSGLPAVSMHGYYKQHSVLIM